MTTVFVESAHAVPIVSVSVFFPSGGLTDPAGLEGLARHAGELMRRGSGALDRAALDARLDRLGASIDVACGGDSIGFVAHGLTRQVDALGDLLASVLGEPRFEPGEHDKLVRESMALLDELRDDDGSLASRFFNRAVFAGHPYGRTTLGTPATLAALTAAGPTLAAKWRATHLRRDAALVAIAGDLDDGPAHALADKLLSALPTGDAPPPVAGAVSRPRGGRRTLIVDKPERTQTQIVIGQATPARKDPDWLPLSVAICAFGGTFTSRLTREVRVERGWSYGASARLGRGRLGGALRMRMFPSLERTADTVELSLKLYEQLVERGLDQAELDFARDYLSGSWAFELATAGDRVGKKLDTVLLELPEDTYPRHLEHLRALTLEQVNAAIRRHLTPADLTIGLVTTAAEAAPALARLDLGTVETVAFDSY